MEEGKTRSPSDASEQVQNYRDILPAAQIVERLCTCEILRKDIEVNVVVVSTITLASLTMPHLGGTKGGFPGECHMNFCAVLDEFPHITGPQDGYHFEVRHKGIRPGA